MKLLRAMSVVHFALMSTVLLFGQVDSNSLRLTFGPPVKSSPTPPREIFRASGLQITATYSDRHRRVCSIEIESGIANAKTVELELQRAVPISKRGKMWNQLREFDGLSGVLRTYYEKVIVTEDIFTSRALDKRPGALVVFKEQECNWKDQGDPLDGPVSPTSAKAR